MRRSMVVVIPAMLLGLGCAQDEALKQVTQEVSDMKIEVFKMRQQVEELNRRTESDRGMFSESRAQDRRFQADLQETLRQLQDATRVLSNRLNETGRRAPSSGGTASVPATAPSEDQSFQALMLDYNRGQYALAAENFEQYARSNPKHPRRVEALYYLGFSHFNLKAYDRALGAFDRVIKEYPQSEQYLSAKFKRAQCQLRMGLKAAAITSFQDIVTNFPGTVEARNAQQELTDLQN